MQVLSIPVTYLPCLCIAFNIKSHENKTISIIDYSMFMYCSQ